jgi:hypothetical protein
VERVIVGEMNDRVKRIICVLVLIKIDDGRSQKRQSTWREKIRLNVLIPMFQGEDLRHSARASTPE